MTIGFELIENGTVVDLSGTAVRWYVDGKLLKNETNGLGIQRLTVYNKKYGGDVLGIKIAIPDHNGQALIKLFDIPVKKPEVVMDIPYAQKKVAQGDNLFYAWPFFFNVASPNDLNMQWMVDGNVLQAKTMADPRLLFSAGNESRSEAKSSIEAVVTNPGKAIERAWGKVLVDLP
ncbi:hypothetical protein A2372_00460 [Candidatus Wolfebacteria bacterium RIFOXYB1_FULL_54_12]|uniref:Uncharacterized protein n=1 Tax=Candidatus Wolfebacteria bacterium RIFOXYB1_FULL_54_12 TaxID=1802559 RepID=A0A1F8DW46_9BACT|nr:MAG: hypothetical protein A2372_00460 [Candidatus Wolfebacteria bacterium RIFOXYB1_FULL_54_12]